MAKISARGDTAAIKLRRANGALVVLTVRGRLLAQHAKAAGYHVVCQHWVQPNVAITHRADVAAYLIEHRYPDAEVIA